MPRKRRMTHRIVEIGATLVHDYDRGHERPWRVCRVETHGKTCWRFADQDDAQMFSIQLGMYFSGPVPAEMDRYAVKLGGMREVPDAG